MADNNHPDRGKVRDVLAEGDRVTCLNDCIDKKHGKGISGEIKGFARFSKYHGREAYVTLDTGVSGWFWVIDLVKA